MPINKRILVAEDEEEIRSYLQMALRCQGYSVELAQDGEEALRLLRQMNGQVGAVLLDVIMPRKDGIEALEEIRASYTDVPVIMISGASAPNAVVNAMKAGATDFIPKPISPEDLYAALGKAIGREAPVSRAPEPEPVANSNQVYFGETRRIREIRSSLRQISWSDAPILLQGETGVGKEVMAREIHANSRRAEKLFLKLNCAALPSELVESELFGYERGAFTGAFQRKPGMFELADEGTLLLDEIGDMDFKLQAKLLQVLQDHSIQRLGGKETIKVDVRIIAATHRDLEGMIAQGKFREDLYFRLNVLPIRVLPLREQREPAFPARVSGRHHRASGVSAPQTHAAGRDGASHPAGAASCAAGPRLAGKRPRTGQHYAPGDHLSQPGTGGARDHRQGSPQIRQPACAGAVARYREFADADTGTGYQGQGAG